MERDRKGGASSWLMTAFAAPGGLSVLANLDDRLDFRPFLERIILNFMKVSQYVWGLVDGLLGIDFLRSIHGQLTFFIIFAGVVMRYVAIRRRADAEFSFPKSLLDLSCQSVIIYIFVIPQELDLRTRLLSAAMYPLFMSGLVLYFSFGKSREPVVIFLYVISILWIGLFPSVFPSEHVSNYDYRVYLVNAVILVIVFLSNLYVRPWNLFYTRIIVFAVGIYLLDYISGVLIPNLDGLLKSIGV